MFKSFRPGLDIEQQKCAYTISYISYLNLPYDLVIKMKHTIPEHSGHEDYEGIDGDLRGPGVSNI